jgi:hypothetical protein
MFVANVVYSAVSLTAPAPAMAERYFFSDIWLLFSIFFV